jgi:periplasmic glucans biosynthesis protein
MTVVMVSGFSRRRVLGGATALTALNLAAPMIAAPSFPGRAHAQAASPFARLNEGQRFDYAALLEAASALAKRPFVAPVINDLPDGYANMAYDQYVTIRALPQAVIWGEENRGMAVEPLHRGYVFNTPTPIFVVEDGMIRRTAYDRSKFDFGKVAPPPNGVDLAFSGFRLFAGEGRGQEMAMFQGPAFFRAIANGQNFGVIGRGLILRPGETRGEEVPHVRAYWIERPMARSGVIVVCSLIESESVTAAMRMTVRPGDVTFIDVEQTLFARNAIDHVGIGGAIASYLYSPASRRFFDEARPAAHEVSGLQMLTGSGEWIYRSVNNPATLQVSAFVDTNPKGFGLVQRDRDFATFQDDDQRFERRPSLWIEPLGEWGAGTVQLMEIPSDNEVNDNIIAYWRPRQGMAPGAEASFSYRQNWSWYPPEKPALATVTRVRQGRGTQARRRRFVIDFNGDILADAGVVTALKANVSAGPGSIQNVRLLTYPEFKGARVSFELDPANEAMAEMRLVLDSGGRAVSETWLNRWT